MTRGEGVSYVVITPARNEADNLPRLARCLSHQTIVPTAWIVVDNGSTDETLPVTRSLSDQWSWIHPITIPGEEAPVRGAPIVRALHAALATLDPKHPPSFVVNLDADLSFEPDFFEQLLGTFGADPLLGIASGTCYEIEKGVWRQRHVTGSTVWGASRVYRWACLQDVLPLEERFAWDGIDEIKANARGWRTRTHQGIPFRHHRREGERDGSRFGARAAQGRAAYYMGYRPWYLVLRALRHAIREPESIGLVWGYTACALAHEERCADEQARAYLRRQQSPRRLPLRARETFGRRRRLSA